jgi:hypothetical protein
MLLLLALCWMSRSPSSAGLRTAAATWAKVFLTGTAAQIKAMEGTQCRSGPHYSNAFLNIYLRGMRSELQDHFGRPLNSIKVLGVDLRNVTSSTGDAEVIYNLSKSKSGNDNWVSYALQKGKWSHDSKPATDVVAKDQRPCRGGPRTLVEQGTLTHAGHVAAGQEILSLPGGPDGAMNALRVR